MCTHVSICLYEFLSLPMFCCSSNCGTMFRYIWMRFSRISQIGQIFQSSSILVSTFSKFEFITVSEIIFSNSKNDIFRCFIVLAISRPYFGIFEWISVGIRKWPNSSCVCLCVRMFVYVCICLYICVCMCVCVHMCVCICTYVYLFRCFVDLAI